MHSSRRCKKLMKVTELLLVIGSAITCPVPTCSAAMMDVRVVPEPLAVLIGPAPIIEFRDRHVVQDRRAEPARHGVRNGGHDGSHSRKPTVRTRPCMRGHAGTRNPRSARRFR